MDAVGIIYTLVETQRLATIAVEGLKSQLFRMENEELLDGFLFGRDLNAIRVADDVNAEDAPFTIIGFNADSISEIVDIMSLTGGVEHLGIREMAYSSEPFTIPASELEYLDVAGDCWMQVEDYKAPPAHLGMLTVSANDNGVEAELIEDAEIAGSEVPAFFDEPEAKSAAPTPAKKQYDRPWLPPKEYFKMLRETGQYKPREKAPDSKPKKRVRSDAERRAIAGHFARKRQQAA
ncbi:hypothetical protein [Microvirga calopogonii]|uniref:hypothetical protein n=1 Tax=Microvirga calopogonii TaxID=2078013 RepID=UPI0013B415B2|nr:hypothetical protein [Microvirga calopogonii]